MNAKIDVTNIRIETPRLILRPWKKTDLQDLFEYASVPGVGEMAGWTHHQSMEESASILDMFMEQKKTLALVLKEKGKVIGSLGIENVKEEPEIPAEFLGREIGYVLSKNHWGKGLMAEAVKAVMEYCFTILRYDYLTCAHFVQNNQSRRVIEKSGFHYLKDVKHETRYGTVEDTKLYICYNPNSEVRNV
ncbi:MAG: GNAT family N-acetyltransferase [Ruminococcaceae bacterium]|nr:GNAT family N-acetyltransferase [Oscillospiraceae bacterium]